MGWYDRSRTWPLWRQVGMAVLVSVAAAAVIGWFVDLAQRDDSAPATTGTDATAPTTAPEPAATSTTTTTAPQESTTPATVPTTTVPVPITPAPAATTTPPATSPAGPLLARNLLDLIPVEREHHDGYDRDLFPTWLDDDGDGCDARDEVLIAESLTPAQVDPIGCTVVAGDWFSPYDGQTLTSPADIEIDHVVALKETWDSGAWAWTPERRIAYANDLSDGRTLIAVSATSNQAKSDKDPSNWLPQPSDVCRFATDWVAIKARWGLSMDESEWGRIKNLLESTCTGSTVAPWPGAP